jgi:hypothetical protein
MEFPNQPPPFEDVSLFDVDAALREAVTRDAAQWAVPGLRAWGQTLGSAPTRRIATDRPCARTTDAVSVSTRSCSIRRGTH